MKLGAGIFWLLVVALFGGAAYFGFHVFRMMEAHSTDVDDKARAAALAESSAPTQEAAP